MTLPGIETTALQRHLERHFAPAAVSALETGATGSSNVTLFFSVTDPGGDVERYVLRTQADGHQLFLDRDVLFQARVMRALRAGSDLPVAEIVLEESDKSIIGTEFFVMRMVGGRTVPNLPNWMSEGWLHDLAPRGRATVWARAVELLARVGRVDWRRELSFLDVPGRGEQGLDRYLAYVEDWYAWAANGRSLPVAEAALRHLRRHQPADAPVELVWGDATLMNMLHADDLSISGIMDWEMATIGPAELDLGWFLFMADMYSTGFGIPRLDGLPGRDETIAMYERYLGRPVAGDMAYYETLAALRMTIVVIRFADLQVEYGRLPPDNTVVANNPASVVLARHLGIEIEVDLEQLAAVDKGSRPD